MDGHLISALIAQVPVISHCPWWIGFGFVLPILERCHAMRMSRVAMAEGRAVRWKGGLRPSVEVAAAPNRSPEDH
jgi:hypothetical protein